MKPNQFAVIGDIDYLVLRDLPPGYVAHVSYEGTDMVVTFARIHHPPPPSKPSQSPGVDIDAVHRKYQRRKP